MIDYLLNCFPSQQATIDILYCIVLYLQPVLNPTAEPYEL